MLKKKLIVFLSLFLLVLAGSAGVFAQGETARGIEKKDIRVLIVYPGNYSPADAEAFKTKLSQRLTRSPAAPNSQRPMLREKPSQRIISRPELLKTY